jgi:hypothetical protein
VVGIGREKIEQNVLVREPNGKKMIATNGRIILKWSLKE